MWLAENLSYGRLIIIFTGVLSIFGSLALIFQWCREEYAVRRKHLHVLVFGMAICDLIVTMKLISAAASPVLDRSQALCDLEYVIGQGVALAGMTHYFCMILCVHFVLTGGKSKEISVSMLQFICVFVPLVCTGLGWPGLGEPRGEIEGVVGCWMKDPTSLYAFSFYCPLAIYLLYAVYIFVFVVRRFDFRSHMSPGLNQIRWRLLGFVSVFILSWFLYLIPNMLYFAGNRSPSISYMSTTGLSGIGSFNFFVWNSQSCCECLKAYVPSCILASGASNYDEFSHVEDDSIAWRLNSSDRDPDVSLNSPDAQKQREEYCAQVHAETLHWA